ncbi:MAG: hypothetical protein PHQ72_14200 [Hespellia sp.]|nr:hypothetical protein [Hespellia sp.]
MRMKKIEVLRGIAGTKEFADLIFSMAKETGSSGELEKLLSAEISEEWLENIRFVADQGHYAFLQTKNELDNTKGMINIYYRLFYEASVQANWEMINVHRGVIETMRARIEELEKEKEEERIELQKNWKKEII